MINNLWNYARSPEGRTYRTQPLDWSALHRAVDNDNLDKIKKLAQDPIELHTRDRAGRGPLHVAVSKGSLMAANLLLEAGAHVDAQDIKGISPLHIAVASGQTAMVKLLINFGANPLIKNDLGESPLKVAQGKPLMEEILGQSYGALGVDTFTDAANKKAAKYFGKLRNGEEIAL